MKTKHFMKYFMLLVSSFLLSSAVFAHKTDHSVPAQLQAIQNTLADMQAEMAAVEVRLNNRLTTLQSSANNLQGSADLLQATSEAIYSEVTAVNIDMTTTLCFNSAAKFEGAIGIEDEVGIGWPNVLSAKATLKGNGGIGGELGVANEICIEVPLYSVPSMHPLFQNADEFDNLIAALALPSQTVVPIIANIYDELMPTPNQAFEAINNVTMASAGYNILTGDVNINNANPIELLRPDLLLEPVIPHAAVEFIGQVPLAVTEALIDPCGTLAATPIGASLQGRQDIEFLCNAHGSALYGIVSIINTIGSGISKVLSFFGL